MAKSDKKTTTLGNKTIRPAETSEARENQMISLATDLVEKQIRDGTVSAMVLSQYIKLGSEKAKLERKKLEYEIKLTQAKTEALESEKRIEELYDKAIKAMKTYTGNKT